MQATMNYDGMTRDDLIAYIEKLRVDISFGIIKKETAVAEWNVPNGTTIIYLDLACMHSANHKYGMSTVDSFIRNITAYIRTSDNAAKFGGDEIVIMLQSESDGWAYMQRLAQVMSDNNMYGTMAYTKSHGGLLTTVDKLDSIVMQDKLESELDGSKAHRDAEYTCGESTLIYVP